MWMASEIATRMIYTGLDPFTGQEVHVNAAAGPLQPASEPNAPLA
jgi:hypothetical protein